jgi:hypothetical protein
MIAIEKILEKIDLNKPNEVGAILAESYNDMIKAGTTVACVDNNIYPMDGVKGKVKSINNGYALVEFANGSQMNMLLNLLIPVQA